MLERDLLIEKLIKESRSVGDLMKTIAKGEDTPDSFGYDRKGEFVTFLDEIVTELNGIWCEDGVNEETPSGSILQRYKCKGEYKTHRDLIDGIQNEKMKEEIIAYIRDGDDVTKHNHTLLIGTYYSVRYDGYYCGEPPYVKVILKRETFRNALQERIETLRQVKNKLYRIYSVV